MRKFGFLHSLLLLLTAAAISSAADWPTHHGNAARTANSDETLTFPLAPAWEHQANQAPSPSFRYKHIKERYIPVITHDFTNQVIAADGKAYYSSSSEEAVVCLDQKPARSA